ncbi:MAG: DUF362 domain-containing protein [Deltaproteobacteria bacterium]|nr:DUF362 domain-containing protein [Deltaproteobacteria bacterium]
MSYRRSRTRRQLLSDAGKTAAGAAALGLGGCFPRVDGSWAAITEACEDHDPAVPLDGASRVIEVHRESSVVEATDASGARRVSLDASAMRPMLEAALAALTDSDTPWRSILPDYSASMRIGLKVNCLNETLPTSVPLVKALITSLREALDVDPARIVVWDRRLDELQPPPPRARFTQEDLGVEVVGTVRSIGDASGPGYSAAICGVVEGRPTRLSRIMTELTDVTINCPVLKTHTISGITGAMKNIYGVIDNPSEYHRNLVTALPALFRLPPIRKHIRLNVLDALIAVTVGGTSSPPDTFPRRILVATDPLAIDSCALALVNQLRAAKGLGLPPVDEALTAWLTRGHQLGLGTLSYDAKRIEQ